jgi:hypothetical protein
MAEKKKKRSLLGRLKRKAKMSKLKRMHKRGVKVSKPKGVPKKELSPKGKIRKGAKKVLLTKGGAYASYDKKSKPAKSFRAAFKAACGSSESGSFSWDGRSYSCKRAKPSKKQKAVRKMKALPGGLKEPRSYS